jgi:hypothetical protein
MEEIEKEILELEKELKSLKDEHQIIEKFFKKGMDGNKYKELLLQKKQNEMWIAEIELEIELLKNERDNG